MKTVTKKFLESNNACSSGMEWVTENKLIGLPKIKFLQKLIVAEKLDWANWLIVRLMDHRQQVQYAIFAAEQVLQNFESKYPDDNRPRKAIEAAKEYLKDSSETNRLAAARAADSAADRAADSADSAAYRAARAAARAADSMEVTILNYGLTLLK